MEQVRTEAQRQLAQAQVNAQRQMATGGAALDHSMRQRIALAHPDHWPDTPLAHDLTVAMGALRATCCLATKSMPAHRPIAFTEAINA